MAILNLVEVNPSETLFKSETQKAVDQFLEGGAEAARVEFTGGSPMAVYKAIYSYVRKNKLPVKVVKNQDNVYLRRDRDD